MSDESKNADRSTLDQKRPSNWTSNLANGPIASPGFVEGVEDVPVTERRATPQRLKPSRKNRNW